MPEDIGIKLFIYCIIYCIYNVCLCVCVCMCVYYEDDIRMQLSSVKDIAR